MSTILLILWFSITYQLISHLGSHIVEGYSNLFSSGIISQLISFFFKLFFLDKAKNSFLRDLVLFFLLFTKMTTVIGGLCILVEWVDFGAETDFMLRLLIVEFGRGFLANLKWKTRKVDFMKVLFATGWEEFHFLFHFLVDFVLVLFINWLTGTVLIFALVSGFGKFIQRLKSDKPLIFRSDKGLMNFLLIADCSWMTGRFLVPSVTTLRFSGYFLNLFGDGFSDFLSLITDVSLKVIHLKRWVPLWSFVIHPFIQSWIGKIVAIMHSGDDIVQLKFAFHEKVVLSFTIDAAAINEWKGFKGVLDYWIDVWLWCVRRILLDLVRLSFWFVVFCLGKVAYHRFVLLRFRNTLLLVCFLSLFIIYNFIHLLYLLAY